LGALLYDNGALDLINAEIDASTFYEPFHGRLFKSIASTIRIGLLAEPITLAEEFRRDPAFKELGGIGYLAVLVDRAPPALNAPDYARTLIELSNLRRLIRLGDTIAAEARGMLTDEDFGRLKSGAIIESAEKELLGLSVATEGRQSGIVSMADAVAAVVQSVNDRSKPVGVLSGLNPLDIQIGPMTPGDLIVLGGRPSMGKSALSLAMALNVAAPTLADRFNGRDYDGRAPKGVLEFHGEMDVNDRDGGQVARRHLADIGFGLFGKRFPTYRQMRDKRASEEQIALMHEASTYMNGVPLHGVKRSGAKLSTIRSLARRQIAAWRREGIEPGLLIIDHAGLIRPDGRTSGRYEAQTEIAIGSKDLAGELEIPVVVLVQLSRQIEQRDDKRPQLSDLRDSGAWEENADVAGFVYRDSYYAKREVEPSQANITKWAEWDARCRSQEVEIILGKVREGDASSARVWADLAFNAARSAAPEFGGALL
jgi:replicative DNA helicase